MSKIKVNVKNLAGNVVKEIEIPQSVFGVELNSQIVNKVLRYGALSQRTATASTKNRSEVAGSGKKRRAQKKSGRARMGERNPVHHRGGSVSFGPNGRKYDISINKKERRSALTMVLSNKLSSSDLIILDELTMNEGKTTNGLKLKDIFGFSGRTVFVDTLENKNYLSNNDKCVNDASIQKAKDFEKHKNFSLAIRNIFDMDYESVHTMNLKQLIGCDKVFFTENSLNELLSRFGGCCEEN